MNPRDEKFPKAIPPELEKIAKEIVDCAYKVHSTLGPGLLESVYEVALSHELKKRGFAVERQVELPVFYDNVRMEAGLRFDMLVNEVVIVEVKAVDELIPVHKAQVLTYLKLTKRRLGFLINFNVPLIKDGIKRVIY